MTSELGSLAEGGIRGTGTFVSLFLAGTVRGPSRGRQHQTESYIVQDDVRTARLSARYEDLTAILSGRPRALSALSLFTHITGPASLNAEDGGGPVSCGETVCSVFLVVSSTRGPSSATCVTEFHCVHTPCAHNRAAPKEKSRLTIRLPCHYALRFRP